MAISTRPPCTSCRPDGNRWRLGWSARTNERPPTSSCAPRCAPGARPPASAHSLWRRGGPRAYVVCPLVEESEKVQGKAAEVEAARLRAEELEGFRVGVIHGQM